MVELSRYHLEFILVTSFSFAAFLTALPRELKVEENRGGATITATTAKTPIIPAVIFNSIRPSTFHLFVLALIFAFTFSLSALLIHDSSNTTTTAAAAGVKNGKPLSQVLTTLFGCFSLVSITTALAIFITALVLAATPSPISAMSSLLFYCRG